MSTTRSAPGRRELRRADSDRGPGGRQTASEGPRSRDATEAAAVQQKPAIDRIIETAIYLQTESRRLAREQCAKHDITATQLNVLKLLQNVGDLSLSELSQRIAATNSTVTGIIDRMTAANLVVREQSAEDRRVWKIRLTPEGKQVARKVTVAPWDILRGALMALPPEELQQLIATLVKVADHVERRIEKAEGGSK